MILVLLQLCAIPFYHLDETAQISTLLVIIRIGIMLSLMKRFQKMITIHWLR